MEDSLFSGLWHLRVHSYGDKNCRTDSNIVLLLEAYRKWPDPCGQWQEQRIPAPRSLQLRTTPLPHPAFKRVLLKASEEFGVWGTRATCPLAWPCNKPFPPPNSDVLVCFALLCCVLGTQTCIQQYALKKCICKKIKQKKTKQNAFILCVYI